MFSHVKSLLLIVFSAICFVFTMQAQSISSVDLVETLEGKKLKFHQLLQDNRIVLVFYSVDCPLCKKYTRTLNQIQKEFENEITLYAVFPGEYQKKKKIRRFLKKYELNVHVLLDSEFGLVDAFEASITPECFLLNNGEIAYRGALDDWVIKLGSTKSEVRHPYLKEAINASIEGSEISPKAVKAIGCFIR